MSINVKGHKIAWDRYQFLFQHPKTCPHKGSSKDDYKTFVGYWLIEADLEDCKISLSLEQEIKLSEIIAIHKATQCGFLPPKSST